MTPDEQKQLDEAEAFKRRLRELRRRISVLGQTARLTFGTPQYRKRKKEWLAAVDELEKLTLEKEHGK